MILVVTVSDDITADYVGSRLVTRGVPFVRLNLDEVYRFGVVSIKPDQGRWVITCAEKYIESDSITFARNDKGQKEKCVNLNSLGCKGGV